MTAKSFYIQEEISQGQFTLTKLRYEDFSNNKPCPICDETNIESSPMWWHCPRCGFLIKGE
jgi:ribosomal protein L37AE/L43A